jgi:hypothetical protein
LRALAELASLDRPALADRWIAAFGAPALKSCQAPLLRQALAWHLQMQALRGQSGVRETRRGRAALKQASVASPVLSPGTRLLRESQGRTHHVTVLAEGFAYDDRVWPSLSAIARAITGTRWSGPAFFGLRS